MKLKNQFLTLLKTQSLYHRTFFPYGVDVFKQLEFDDSGVVRHNPL